MELLYWLQQKYPILYDEVILFNTVLSVLFILILIINFIVILKLRISKWYYTIRKNALTKTAVNYITSELFQEGDRKKNRKFYALRKIKSTENKKIFTRQCFELHKNISGEMQQGLHELFTDLGLKNFIFNRMFSFDWIDKAAAISALAEMNCQDALPEISKYVNHYKTVLRYEAQVACIRLDNEKPFDFLDYTQKPINTWQQIKILETAKQIDSKLIPDFNIWLDHKEITVRILCLKLCAAFSQYQCEEAIIEKLYSAHESEFLQAIVTVKTLSLFGAAPVLRTRFLELNIAFKREILKALAVVGSNENADFFINLLDHEDFEIREIACQALLTQYPYELSELQNNIEDEKQLALEELIDHCELKIELL